LLFSISFSWDERDVVPLFGYDFHNKQIPARQNPYAWVLFMDDLSGQAEIWKAVGTLTVQHELEVRTWGDDMFTFTNFDKANSEGLHDWDLDATSDE